MFQKLDKLGVRYLPEFLQKKCHFVPFQHFSDSLFVCPKVGAGCPLSSANPPLLLLSHLFKSASTSALSSPPPVVDWRSSPGDAPPPLRL
jgi:hypothetical protein